MPHAFIYMFSVTYFTPQWQSQGVLTKTIWPTRTKNQLPGTSIKKDWILLYSIWIFLVIVVIISEKKVTQLCLTLCDRMDYTVLGILQARILEWVSDPFSRGSSQSRDLTQVSRIAGVFFIRWVTREAQEYWSGYPIPSPGDLPNSGVELGSLALQADSLPSEPAGKPKNTGVGSLSLLQWIFRTQESNQSLYKSSCGSFFI